MMSVRKKCIHILPPLTMNPSTTQEPMNTPSAPPHDAPADQKQNYIQSLESHVDDWKSKIQNLENSTKSQTAEGQSKLQDMKQQLSDMESKIGELKQAGGAEWNDITSGIESAKNDLHGLGGFFGK